MLIRYAPVPFAKPGAVHNFQLPFYGLKADNGRAEVMKEILVVAIDWLDREAKEANVQFEIGGHRYNAFLMPCELEVGCTYRTDFSCLEEEISVAAMLGGNAERRRELIPRGVNSWSYEGYGVIKGLHPLTVDCGNIELELFDRFRDERLVGEPIFFVIARLDLDPIPAIGR